MNSTDRRVVGFLFSFFMTHVEAHCENERLRRVAAKHDEYLLAKSNYPQAEVDRPAQQT